MSDLTEAINILQSKENEASQQAVYGRNEATHILGNIERLSREIREALGSRQAETHGLELKSLEQIDKLAKEIVQYASRVMIPVRKATDNQRRANSLKAGRMTLIHSLGRKEPDGES